MIRFKEFKGKWPRLRLKDVLIERGERNVENKFTEVFSVAKESGVVNQVEHLGRSYAAEDISKYKIVCPGDVIYTKSPTAGFPFGIIKQNKTNRNGVVSVLYAVYKPNNIYIGELLDFYFSSRIKTFNYLVPLVHIGAKNTMNIGNGEFLNGKFISLPNQQDEQKKIAEFLRTVENRIRLLREKHKVLEEYRKSVVKKIFNKEIRFKDSKGNAFPDWKRVEVSKILKRYSNPVTVKPKDNYTQIGIKSHGKGIFYKEPVTGKSLGSKRVFWLKEDLLILNIVFAWERAVARTTKQELGLIASHRFPMYTPVKGLADLDYILYFFLTPRGKYYLELASPGGAGRNKTLGQADFESLAFDVPSFDEQKKIADFIKKIDRSISQLAEQISANMKFKLGVIQNIFEHDEQTV